MVRDSGGMNESREPLTPSEMAVKYQIPVAEVIDTLGEDMQFCMKVPNLTGVVVEETKDEDVGKEAHHEL